MVNGQFTHHDNSFVDYLFPIAHNFGIMVLILIIYVLGAIGPLIRSNNTIVRSLILELNTSKGFSSSRPTNKHKHVCGNIYHTFLTDEPF